MSERSRRAADGTPAASADLRIAVVGPTHPLPGPVAMHTTALAHGLEATGHDVALVSWRHLHPRLLEPGGQSVAGGAPSVPPYPRTSRPLSWARPDSWWRTGQRLQDADVVVVVHVGPAVVPAHLALMRAARGGATRPTVVALVHDVLPGAPRPGDEALMRRFLGAADAVLVHGDEQARAARDLGALDVSVAALPPHLPGEDPIERPSDGVAAPDLSGPWARYLAAIETIAAVRSATDADHPAAPSVPGPRPLVERAASAARGLRSATRREVALGPRDLPDWVRPTDVLLGDDEAEDVIALARSLGLPWVPTPPGPPGKGRRTAAWAALGALSAVLRVRDGERRSSLVVDAAGTSTLFSRWARSIGYAPAALRLSDPAIDPGSLDVVVRLHPHGCTAADVDLALAEAARLLRRGGLVSVTLPVRKPGDATAVSPADLRAVAARADATGLALVGDLDRDIAPLLGELEPGAGAWARLTFRRR